MFYLLLTTLIHENCLCAFAGFGMMLIAILCIVQGWAYQ